MKAKGIGYGVCIVIFFVTGAIEPHITYGGVIQKKPQTDLAYPIYEVDTTFRGSAMPLKKESTKYSTLYWSNERYSDLIKKEIAPNVDRYIEDMISKFVSGDWSQDINTEIWFSDVNTGIPKGKAGTYKNLGTYNIISLNPTRDHDSLTSDLIHELAHLVQVKYNPNLTVTEYENFAKEMEKWLRR